MASINAFFRSVLPSFLQPAAPPSFAPYGEFLARHTRPFNNGDYGADEAQVMQLQLDHHAADLRAVLSEYSRSELGTAVRQKCANSRSLAVCSEPVILPRNRDGVFEIVRLVLQEGGYRIQLLGSSVSLHDNQQIAHFRAAHEPFAPIDGATQLRKVNSATWAQLLWQGVTPANVLARLQAANQPK